MNYSIEVYGFYNKGRYNEKHVNFWKSYKQVAALKKAIKLYQISGLTVDLYKHENGELVSIAEVEQ